MKNFYLRKNNKQIMVKTLDGNLYIDLDSKYIEDEINVVLNKIWDLGRRYERSMQ